MASSPSHKFGQIIGNMLEEIIYPFLKEFADGLGYYVDRAGLRGRARPGRKVKWTDKYGNDHDLDFVIEDGGTPDKRGRPVAFIEAAWRRYTKHSRNKAQEIQGAVLPIADKHSWDAPFLGAIIAGVFTEGSIRQLESVGFDVLYMPYDTVVEAFDVAGINARFDESTPDEEFSNCVTAIEGLGTEQFGQIKQRLAELNAGRIETFIDHLQSVLGRTVRKIIICPLFGVASEFTNVTSAIAFLGQDFTPPDGNELRSIEIIVEYSNGDKVQGSFKGHEEAIGFLFYATRTKK